MASTEQKDVTRVFMDHCHIYGILPAVCIGELSDYALDTHRVPFRNLGETPNLSTRLNSASDPVEETLRVLPDVMGARSVTTFAPFILKVCSDTRVHMGNRAVLKFVEGFINDRWGLYLNETGAIKHAKVHAGPLYAMFAPGSYGNALRSRRNYLKLNIAGESYRYRSAADAIDYLYRGGTRRRQSNDIRRWCRKYREESGFKLNYRKRKDALIDFHNSKSHSYGSIENPPHSDQKILRTRRFSTCSVKVYRVKQYIYIKICYNLKLWANRKAKNELFIFNARDIDDIKFLFCSCSAITQYYQRRKRNIKEAATKAVFETAVKTFWSSYLDVMKECSSHYHLRNKLGVYFDVLQWRHLADLSGNEFKDHSYIMAQKVKTKGLSDLPTQSFLLDVLKRLPNDVAIDLLGIYKASIYPEVDPFKVVGDQYDLHMSRFDTNWKEGSKEYIRFEDTRSYMWYLGIRVIYAKQKIWPGKIRDGSEHKEWHRNYKIRGIPGDKWREARDVDLTGSVPIADISNNQYFRQNDAAAAPADPNAFCSMAHYRRCPLRQKRKLLYAIQEPHLPDLPKELENLSAVGRNLPELYTGKIDYKPNFTTDIVTGSRCERHKDAPRPFYAASSPWGCIISFIDGVTRDFLSDIPQSMMGKSTRQKFLDLSSAADFEQRGTQMFFMSDDKAKYSPRMDPRSQQLPADFFAELFGLPAIKAIGPIMYHCNLYYRVCGHLVHYSSNGTDREGMRGASNTWVEIVAQGLATRLARERDLIRGRSLFLSFIDDGLRKFGVSSSGKSEMQIRETAIEVINDVEFGLKVLGRELSWDKTFISRDMFVILNELVYDKTHLSSGLKSFCTIGDVEPKEVMNAASFEQLYYGKMRGAITVGAPLDMCFYNYILETLISHHRMGLRMQDNKSITYLCYRTYCMTPIAFGGAGIRGPMQMSCNEVSNATKEGMGNMLRLATDVPIFTLPVHMVLKQDVVPLSPIDFMREPEQFHVAGPRIRTQRVVGEVRNRIMSLCTNEHSRAIASRDRDGMLMLESMGKVFMALGDVSAEEIRLLYASSPVAFVDQLIQKVSSSQTLSGLLDRDKVLALQRQCRRDLVDSAFYFEKRSKTIDWLRELSGETGMLLQSSYFVK